jgi:catechol 2,3-dioxygenase-like lactoylglutathione lyase family enzyme
MPHDGPVLDQVNLVVSNMEASVAFYELLGLTFQPSPVEWAGHHRSAVTPAGLDFDLDSSEFAATWNRGWPGRSGQAGAVISFRLASRDEVDARFAALTAAGSPAQQVPYDTFWGSRYAIVEDPDGNAVGLMSEPDPARREPPPDPESWSRGPVQ